MESSGEVQRPSRAFWITLALVVTVPVIAAYLFAVIAMSFNLARDRHRNTCFSHLRMLAVNLNMYAHDWEGQLPLPPKWAAAVRPAVDPAAFDCPRTRQAGTFAVPDYGMNAFLFDVDAKTRTKRCLDIGRLENPSAVEYLLEIDAPAGAGTPFPGSFTATGYPGAGNAAARERGRCLAAFVDGHTAAVDPALGAAAQYGLPRPPGAQ